MKGLRFLVAVLVFHHWSVMEYYNYDRSVFCYRIYFFYFVPAIFSTVRANIVRHYSYSPYVRVSGTKRVDLRALFNDYSLVFRSECTLAIPY